ncbi:acyl-CoA N-acyltransferase [Byssothecium circinans]|uniref:Acyl-CoA N-acyltransferase n=1 Tax=Byssothecium circinans TaxID=147558 RepID=A0A6A5TEG7_9PLEO|nr:acyl-CoA N-acyltransferase [Byssothecium circinans]
MSTANVTVEPYNPLWPTHFHSIKAKLSSHLSTIPLISIEHVGSTSVPNLAAKPIIDIDIIVTRENLQPAIACLAAHGFTYLGELGIKDRHCLKDPDQAPKRNTYVCIDGAAQTRNHLGVRDTLRKNAALRDEYRDVKIELAKRGTNIIDYIEAKSPILQKVLQASGLLTREELLTIEAVNRKGGKFGAVETGREGLVLREFVLGDEEAFFELESIADVVRYQTWGPRTREQARDLVAEIVRNSEAVPRVHVELAVEFEGSFVGRVGAKVTASLRPTALEAEESESTCLPHADLWFSFLPSYQGKGLATEAMKCFVALLKPPLELEIECDPRNTGSVKMAERLGFEKISEEEKVFECKGEWVGSCVFRKNR